MGRKGKRPVEIESNSQGGTEVPSRDGLPGFARFIDIHGLQRGEKAITRLFLAAPSYEDVADTVKLKESRPDLVVLCAYLPYMGSAKAAPALFDHCKTLGFADEFATDLARLLINHLQGKQNGSSKIRNTARGLQKFVEFLAAQNQKPSTLTDINKGTWWAFLEAMEADQRSTADRTFYDVRAPFAAYGPTSVSGWLAGISFKAKRRTKPSPEHTSELTESRDYSDVVMYQLLALFIYEFKRRIGYLKRYQSITEADMPKDWLYPGRIPVRGKGSLRDTVQLVRQWLRDEDGGYQVLIDHHLTHYKAGLIRRDKGGSLSGGITNILKGMRATLKEPLVTKFRAEMGRRHGYDTTRGGVGFFNFYLKKETPIESNYVINQIGWCLANLLMMQTGVNLEVALTIPSKAEDGRSILTRGDAVFVKKDGGETEINMYGIKARTGNSPMKTIPVIISKSSPLYQMLVDYERYVKVGDGPFFEFDNSFKRMWNTAGLGVNMSERYPLMDEKGQQLSSIDSTRFRKVFLSGQLIDRMKNIKDMNEFAEAIRNDVHHGNLDVTLTNYIMKSSVGRSVIDIAIATITGGKLNDLKCKSQIEGRKPVPFKKKVFLCHCADPQNPGHDVAIADECRHYDLCLGCEQSIITKEHLPYICLRIIQYEAERAKDPHIWPALYEDKWCIAHDALARYIEKNKKNGRHLVDEAWITAHEGRITLPPIIAPNRM